jgi:hypothetical protein
VKTLNCDDFFDRVFVCHIEAKDVSLVVSPLCHTVHFSCLLGLASNELYRVFGLVKTQLGKGPLLFAKLFAVGHKKVLLGIVTDKGDVV